MISAFLSLTYKDKEWCADLSPRNDILNANNSLETERETEREREKGKEKKEEEKKEKTKKIFDTKRQ